MAARTLRFSSVATKLTARSRQSTEQSGEFECLFGGSLDVASIPGCRFQESILEGVLNTKLDDIVAELFLAVVIVSDHHSAERQHNLHFQNPRPV